MKLNPTQTGILSIMLTCGADYKRYDRGAIANFLTVDKTKVDYALRKLTSGGLIEKVSKRCHLSSVLDTRYRITEAGASHGVKLEPFSKDAVDGLTLDPTCEFGPPDGWDALDMAAVILPSWPSGYYTISFVEYERRIAEREAKKS